MDLKHTVHYTSGKFHVTFNGVWMAGGFTTPEEINHYMQLNGVKSWTATAAAFDRLESLGEQ